MEEVIIVKSNRVSRVKSQSCVDGGTVSMTIRACCFDGTNGKIVGKSYAVQYTSCHPQGCWAEQRSEDWRANLGSQHPKLLKYSKGGAEEIKRSRSIAMAKRAHYLPSG